MDKDKQYMKLALQLAEKGRGWVSPNPMVGCVIVRNGNVISTGYHEYFGGAHAELDALKKCKPGQAKGADMYVNLEPCCHYNKKTDPCVPLIIKSGIKNVIIAMKDPNPLVSGKGTRQLKISGIQCKTGILQEEAEQLNESYIKFITKKIPFVTLKMAFSADGKTKTSTGDSKWISSDSSRKIVHTLRSTTDAVLVGINTVLKDNPELTSHGTGKNPVRVILDENLKIPLSSNVINGPGITVIAASKRANKQKKLKLREIGTKMLEIPLKNTGYLNLKKLLIELGKLDISSLLVEGGETIARSFLAEKLVDKIMFFFCPKITAGAKKMKDAVVIKNPSVKKIENDLLYEGYLNN
ncbi:MAG: bifunctional diaminohydroxyphosphoribosylaminopyrimidine deaminase/5-amino-6-(5-phosphoribosylamino)uracil reductase RibD [Elusimicrobia bacterium]|nr:bifunctional diaminohydroxyphosphoribosylaminopyrimidine deaminase/5-amino-6-(5-phosphoribosylamino)uracil reductase RibD [Elusimicrobiota bacterium]